LSDAKVEVWLRELVNADDWAREKPNFLDLEGLSGLMLVAPKVELPTPVQVLVRSQQGYLSAMNSNGDGFKHKLKGDGMGRVMAERR
jgi:hypothetical protein